MKCFIFCLSLISFTSVYADWPPPDCNNPNFGLGNVCFAGTVVSAPYTDGGCIATDMDLVCYQGSAECWETEKGGNPGGGIWAGNMSIGFSCNDPDKKIQ